MGLSRHPCLRTNAAKLVADVLGEISPVYDLPKQERYSAPLHGKVLRHSGELRGGLAVSLVMLSLNDGRLQSGLHGQERVRMLLRQLLPPAWKHWASLSPHLPLLAEADPATFLHLVEESLRLGEAGVCHLLQEEEFFGHSPHTGLLWALEGLGWDRELMPRVVYALGRLAACDPGGRLGNRPAASLRGLLHPVLPQTLAPVEDRLAVLRKLFQREPQVAWALSRRLFPGMGILDTSHRPQWLAWALPAKDAPTGAPVAEAWKQIEGVVQLLLDHAGDTGTRWAELINEVYHSPDELSVQVLEALAAHHAHIQDPDARIWSALRKQLWLLTGSQGAARSEDRIRRTEQTYQIFTPLEFVLRIAWLFQTGEHLPQRFPKWEEEEARRQQLQQEALAELWQQDDPWQALAGLATGSIGRVYEFTRLLAQSPGAVQLEERLLQNSGFGPYASIAPLFLAWRLVDRDMSTRTSVLQRILAQGRVEEAAQLAQCLQPVPALWDFLDEVGEPLRSRYWKGASAPGTDDSEQQARAVQNFISVEAWPQALASVSYRQVRPPVATIIAFLTAFRNADQAAQKKGASLLPKSNDSYQIVDIFEYLAQAESVDPNQILPLEIYFAPLLLQAQHQPHFLVRALGKMPELFVHLVELMYPPEGGPRPAPEPTEDQKRRADAAYQLLDGWEGIPGAELSPPDREDRIYQWASEVLKKTSESGRIHAGAARVAEVLARAPSGDDGFWPCLAARRLLEQHIVGLSESLASEGFNQRGVVRKEIGEGGKQERSLVDYYQNAAQRLRIDWPETAKVLQRLAERYHTDAEDEDLRARGDRRKYGMPASAIGTALATPPSDKPPVTQDDPLEVDFVTLKNIGPAPSLQLKLRSRLNLITGDNSAGKTLVLDVLWWTLTGTWAGLPALPRNGRRGEPSITFGSAETGGKRLISNFDAKREEWSYPEGGTVSSLVLYARVDDGFSVWDPVRNLSHPALRGGYHFTAKTLWEGLRVSGQEEPLCEGLLRDWLAWQSREPEVFALFKRVLEKLSAPDEPLRPGAPERVSIRRAQDLPTLAMRYGIVPITLASAAIKRVLGLCYLLLWTWHEHQRACAAIGRTPSNKLVFIIDEIEAHLHPKWQRAILPAFLKGVSSLSATMPKLQIVASTHAPLILASIKTVFDPEQDQLLHFGLQDDSAYIEEVVWS